MVVLIRSLKKIVLPADSLQQYWDENGDIQLQQQTQLTCQIHDEQKQFANLKIKWQSKLEKRIESLVDSL